MHHMLNVKPFMAEANFAQPDDTPDIRKVQVIGLTQADDWSRPAWVAIETVDGWERPRIVDEVRWIEKPVFQ